MTKQVALQLASSNLQRTKKTHLLKQEGILQHQIAFGLDLHYQVSWVAILPAFGQELELSRVSVFWSTLQIWVYQSP